MAAVVDYVSSWAARLQSRLYLQFKDDPSWNLWCTDILGPQLDALEGAAQGLLALYVIASGVGGAQLDLVGRIVGQPRLGASDATYRTYILARIAANRSDGSSEAIYKVLAQLVPGQSLRITRSPIKSFALNVGGITADALAQVAVSFLGDAKDAGDRGILEWQEQADSATFTTATATFCKVATGPGAFNMAIDPRTCAKFPATGTVIIDAGLPTQETIGYNEIDLGGQSLMWFSAFTSQSHAIGAEIELVGDAGLGWGDPNNASVGGQLAWAGQAP